MAVYRKITSFFLVLAVACLKGMYTQGSCERTTSCSCQYANGQHVDLTPLADTGGRPRFLNMSDVHGYDAFSWNPCYNFTEGPCKDVAVCQIRPMFPHDQYFTIGWQDTAKFGYNNNTGKLELSYTAVSNTAVSKDTRTAIITLTCAENGNTTLIVTGQKTQTSHIFLFELKSPHACPKGDKNSNSGLSKTDIILISSLSGGVTMVVVVILVVLKMTGKICKKATYETLN